MSMPDETSMRGTSTEFAEDRILLSAPAAEIGSATEQIFANSPNAGTGFASSRSLV
jgi:hypothetical protein